MFISSLTLVEVIVTFDAVGGERSDWRSKEGANVTGTSFEHFSARATSAVGDPTESLGGDPSTVEVSVIVPTRHEAQSVLALVEQLEWSLADFESEVIFVDDSDDETPAVIDALVRSHRSSRCAISLLHRPLGERPDGLGGAVLAGLRIARGAWVCVMDGDLQHPPELVPVLLQEARASGAGIVVGSRYRAGGAADGLQPTRSLISRGAASLARFTFPRKLRDLTDPMSGFFLFRRDGVDADQLRPIGFKILLEIVVRSPELKVVEVPYQFGKRTHGMSKASPREGIAYARHLSRLRVDVPPRQSARTVRSYDIHGIIAVESEGKLPELEPFRVARLDRPSDITVRIGALPRIPPLPTDRFSRHLRYRERGGNLAFGADIMLGETVDVLATPLLRYSPHVLYTNLVEPILRWEFARRGYALAHGACIVRGSDAFMVTARTDTGKTTTMLKLLDAEPYTFIADDLTIVRPNGEVLPYPKPLTISNHTLHAVKRPRLNRRERTTLPLQSRLHSRSGRRFAFILARTGLPVATVNTIVQVIVPPPKYPVQRLVPGVEIAEGAKLAGLLVIQRSGDGFEWLAEDDALEILLSNCEDAYGFPPYHRIEDFLLGASRHDLRQIERQVLGGALEGIPSALLSSTALDWATRIPALIEELTPHPSRSEAVLVVGEELSDLFDQEDSERVAP
jgi:hypothetical protein